MSRLQEYYEVMERYGNNYEYNKDKTELVT